MAASPVLQVRQRSLSRLHRVLMAAPTLTVLLSLELQLRRCRLGHLHSQPLMPRVRQKECASILVPCCCRMLCSLELVQRLLLPVLAAQARRQRLLLPMPLPLYVPWMQLAAHARCCAICPRRRCRVPRRQHLLRPPRPRQLSGEAVLLLRRAVCLQASHGAVQATQALPGRCTRRG